MIIECFSVCFAAFVGFVIAQTAIHALLAVLDSLFGKK